jgi:transposase
MDKATFILGVDVSKLTLDVHCAEVRQHIQIPNTTEGYRILHAWCKTHGIDLPDALVALEYTGGYEYRFLQHLQAKQIRFVRIPGLAIKRSLGIARGKNDQVDAARIARYARHNEDQLKPQQLNETLIQLKELLSFRKRLVRNKAADKATLAERRHMKGPRRKDIIEKTLSAQISKTAIHIKQVNKAIEAVVTSNETLRENYRLLTSIRGIGPVNAWLTLAYTENFTAFDDARSYAVYVGVVPFDHSSGTSIHGKKRVSHIANKELKAELDCAARSAMRYDPELRLYAERLAPHKHYKVIKNNVKFKLILRMFAVVKKRLPFVDNYRLAA